jgi:hypothetical protein
MSNKVKWFVGLTMGPLVLLCLWAGLSPASKGTPTDHSSVPALAGGPVATGTATEQRLCADLRSGASATVVYRDANAVNNDLSTGPDDLSLEALAYMNSAENLPGSPSVAKETERLMADCVRGGV